MGATLGALPPPQREDLRGLPLTRNQPHDAVAPELERNLNDGKAVAWAAFSAPCGGRRCAKRRRTYPGPTQASFLAYPASARWGEVPMAIA